LSIDRLGIGGIIPRVRLSDGDKAKMIALRKEGRSLAAIAALIGCSTATASTVVRGLHPKVVHGLNGREYTRVPVGSPRACSWCGLAHRNPGPWCSTSCRREQRHLQTYIAEGRIPQWRKREH
jgi:hypothetical protein